MNLFKRIFKGNYVSKLWIQRMDAMNFKIYVILNNGRDDREIIEYNGRKRFILNLGHMEKKGTLTDSSYIKVTKKDAEKIINCIGERFKHYSDIINPLQIYSTDTLNIAIRENAIIFNKINQEDKTTYELEMEMNLTDIIQTFADCINFAYSNSISPVLEMETEQEMNEYSDNGELSDYEFGVSHIIVDKETMTFELYHLSKNNREDICKISIVELSKILQKIREYYDDIVKEIELGTVYWED